GSETGLAGLWNFEEASNPGRDVSLNSKNATLVRASPVFSAPVTSLVRASVAANVLSLDGTNSYVELPPRLFTDEVVTVEGWVKWRHPGIYSRFFEFDDAAMQIAVSARNRQSDLGFERYRVPGFDDRKFVDVPGILPMDQWCHIAVATGTNWSKLYFNGALVSTNEVAWNWKPSPLPELKNFLGRSVMKNAVN